MGVAETFRHMSIAISPEKPANLASGRLQLRFYGQSGILPRMESSLKRPDVLVTEIQKPLRQTGAGSLVRSGAIDNNGLVLRNS